MNTDAKIRDLEHGLEEKEREIQMLRESIHEYNTRNPVSDERMKGVEKRINELDGLMKGLMDEMLDVKACLQKISKSLDEGEIPAPRRTQRETRERRYPPVVSPSAAAEKKASTTEAGAEASRETLIIQPDGTMKPEVQSGDEMIVADHRSGRSPGRRGDPREKKPLIYADDDDSIEIKRKNSR